MSTDTVTPTETVVHDEVIPTTTAVETEASVSASASASEAEAEASASAETTEQHQQAEGSSSNGAHANGTTNIPETSEVSHKEQHDSYNHDEQDSKPSPSNKTDLEPESLRKVFIGGLSYKTDDQAFREYFSQYGDIADCIIMRDREGRSRGFGFVTYTASTMVDQLMLKRPHVLDGREIEPKRAVPREESGKPESALTAKKLFVGGIREGAINEEDLNEYFSKYGHIIDAVIMKTNEGKFRGFGFVEFDDYDPVDKIVLEKHHVIKGNPVNVEKALPKDQTNRARMSQSNYGGPSGGGMRGPPPRANSGAGGGGWGPMGGESNYGGPSNGGNGYQVGGGSGGYGSGGDYGSRPGPYGGGYGGDMSGGSVHRGANNGMMGYGGSGPMNGSGYGTSGSGRGGYNDAFGAFGQQSGFGFGQGYGSSGGGGPMRRGMGGARSGGAPYGRGGGGSGPRGGGGPSFRGRN